MPQDAASALAPPPVSDNGRIRESPLTSSGTGVNSRLSGQEYLDALLAEQERHRQLHFNDFPLLSALLESEISRARAQLSSRLRCPAAGSEMRNFKTSSEGEKEFYLSDEVKREVLLTKLHDTCVTTSGLSLFLLKWLEKEREIQAVEVRVDEQVSSQKWRDVMDGLNRCLVDVVEKADEPEGKFSATLRRRCDGVEVMMRWKEHKVHIKRC